MVFDWSDCGSRPRATYIDVLEKREKPVKEEKPALVPPEPKLELERSQVDVSLAAKARFSECSYFFCFASDESLETGCHSRLCSEGVARDLVYGTRCIVSTLHAV